MTNRELLTIRMMRDYLTELLTTYWFAPPVALWRAVELRVAAEEQYERPLLDLGCGDGLIGQALFGTEGYADVGFDPWMDQLCQAARSGVYRHVDLADGHHLPYPDGAFATVFSNSVLEHIPNVGPVVREAGRVLRCPATASTTASTRGGAPLREYHREYSWRGSRGRRGGEPAEGRPGGHFIFTVPSDAFRILLDGYIRPMGAGNVEKAERYAAAVDAWLEHHHYHTPEEWGDLLAAAGMTLVKARYYIPEQVERLWDRMNGRYSVGQPNSAWGMLVSPRLRPMGYQALLRRVVVRSLSRRWRPYYEMDVPPGEKGGGLLIVARRNNDQ